MIPNDDPKDPPDLDDIPDFLLEAAKRPRKPPEPPKSAIPADFPKQGPTAMNTQPQTETPKPKRAKADRLPVPPPRVRTPITKPTAKAAGKPPAAPKAKAAPKVAPKAKTAPKAARKAAKAPKTDKTPREGSKLAIITELLTRKGGCTGAEVLAATGWPSVSMPQQAEAAGLKLSKIKEPGKPTRYWGK